MCLLELNFCIAVPATPGKAAVGNVAVRRHSLKCLLVRYPSRQHFLAMMANAAYREALVHRYAGLERTILLQMQG